MKLDVSRRGAKIWVTVTDDDGVLVTEGAVTDAHAAATAAKLLVCRSAKAARFAGDVQTGVDLSGDLQTLVEAGHSLFRQLGRVAKRAGR